MSDYSSWVLSAAFCGFATWAVPALSADIPTKAPVLIEPGPAVDGINGKVDGFGGSLNKRALYGGEGAFSLPLGQRFGFQVDGAGGSLGGSGFSSVAGHLFWRDPTAGLIGAYASHTRWDAFGGVQLSKYGAEGAWYAGRWTLEGVVGLETGTRATVGIGTGVATTIDLATRVFDHVSAAYYLTDNAKLFVGHVYTGGSNAVKLGGEVGFALRGGAMAALFAEGRIGEAGHHGVWGGLKLYFGQREKTLIRRNREDDPGTTTQDNLHGITNGTSSTPEAPVVTCVLVGVGGALEANALVSSCGPT